MLGLFDEFIDAARVAREQSSQVEVRLAERLARLELLISREQQQIDGEFLTTSRGGPKSEKNPKSKLDP